MSQTIKRASKAVIVLLIIFVMGISTNLGATHIVGGTMSFACNGQEWYEITLTIRRDCEFGAEDAPFDELARVGIFDAFGNPLNFLGNLGDLYMPIIEHDTIDSELPDCGYLGSPVCVEEATYRAKIWLPFREKGYVLAYQRCCRNQTLTNIVSPLETGGTWFVCLTEETLTQGNSSPYFGEWPEIIICQDEPYVFDHSAMETLLQCEKDPSLWQVGDSLAYHLFTPFVGATIDDPKPIDVLGPPYDTLEYSAGYGLQNLLGGIPLKIDPVTGLITATPNSVGQFIVGVLVEEWRGGVLLSKVRRDFEINVRACNVIPDIGFETDSELNCESLTVTVENTSTDMYDFVWDFNYPSDDSSFISKEKNPPPFTYTQPGEYTIRLSSANPDNDCEVVVERNVRVFESDLSASFEYELSACAPSDPGLFEITLHSTSSEPDTLYEIESLLWTADVEGEIQTGTMDTFIVDAACAQEVLVTLLVTSSNGCTSDTSALIKLFDEDSLMAPMDTLTICKGGMVALLEKSPPLNGSILYDWGNADLIINDTETNADAKAMPDTTTLYEVKVSYGSKVVEGFVLVVVVPPPSIELPDTLIICAGVEDTVFIENPNAYTLTWSPLTGIDISNSSNPVFHPDSSTLYRVTVSNGTCEVKDSIFVHVIPVNQECIDQAGVILDKEYSLLSADTCIFSFTFNSAQLQESCGVEGAEWELNTGREILTGSGLTFEGQFAIDSCEGIIATLNLTFKGLGECTLGQYSDTMSILKDPTIIFPPSKNDTLELCAGENANFLVNYNECFLYGISVTGELDIIGPGSDSLIRGYIPGIIVRGNGTVTVTASNGVTSVTQSLNVKSVDPVSLSIVTDSLICDGEVNVMAIPSDGSTDLIYEWSLSPQFDSASIIGSAMVETLAISGDATIYLRAIDRMEGGAIFCGSDVASVQVVDRSLNLSVITDTINICESPTGMVVVIDLETGLPDNTIVWSTSESTNIEGDPTDNPLTVRALEGQNEIVLTYTTNRTTGCNSSGQAIIPVIGQVEVNITTEDTTVCSSTIILSAEASLPVMPFDWSLNSSFQNIVATGNDVEIDLSSGLNKIYVRATTSDTCDTDIDSISIFNGVLDLLIDFQPINRCISNETVVFFSSIDPDQQIDSLWFDPNENIVEIFPNNSVRILASEGQSNIEIHYTALSNSGCEVSDTVKIEIFDDLEVNINVSDSKICDGTGKFVAEVNAPIDSVLIQWSFDSEFNVVVGTGQEILIDVPSTVEQIYVMVSSPGHPDCTPDTDSALLEDLRFKGTPVFSPLNLCIADFTDVFIETNFPGQTVQVVWAPSENIEGNLTDNPVRVKAVGSEDTIRLSYTVTAELAEGVVCVDSGTVSIPVFTDLTIEIQGAPGVCNGVGYFEGLFNANPDDIMITWSFSSDFVDIIAVGKRAEVNIPEGATTIYASVAGVGDCPGAVASLSLDDVTFKAIAETEPINRCITPTGQVTLVNSFADLPMSVIWEASDNILGGLTDNPQSVTALEGEDEIVLVYMATTILENGSECMTMDTVRIEVSDDLEVNISVSDSKICDGTGKFVAAVNAPIDSLLIQWSFDSEFTVVVGTGQEILIDVPSTVEQIYVMVSSPGHPDCTPDTDSALLEDLRFKGTPVFSPLNLCIADFTDVFIETNFPGQTAQVVWAPSENIEGNLTDNPVRVKAVGSEDTIRLSYTVTAELAEGVVCVDSGTVSIPVFTDLTIEIQGDPGVCNGVGYFEGLFNANPDDIMITWSFSSDFADIIAVGKRAEVNIPEGATTIYASVAGVGDCPGAVASLSLDDVTFKAIAETEPINRCITPTGQVTLVNSFADLPMSVIWEASDNILGGLTDNPQSVTALEGEDEIVLVYMATTILENGSECMTMDTVRIEVSDDLEVNISVSDSKICDGTGKFVAEVNAPIDSVLIQWSFDSEFNVVVGTGQEILIDVPSTVEKIYVMVSSPGHPDCTPDTDSALLEDLRFKGTPVFSPLNLCIADFTDVFIETNFPGQTVQVVWAPSENIEGNLTDNPVRVKAVGSEDTIRLSYTVTAELAEGVVCVDSGTVSIPVFTDLTIEIQGAPGVCNGVGYFEGLFNANPDDIMITWSFSSDFVDIIAVGKRAEVNIPEGATTIYASVAGVGDCPGAVASLSLDDVTFKAIAETEPINRCITPTGQVTLVNSFADLPMSVIWEASDNILGGLTDNPQSVTALEGEDEIVLVYMATTILENGSECMTMDTVRIEVSDDLEVNISVSDSKICDGTGKFVAAVNAPIDSLLIQWSFDSEFTVVVGTGQEILIDVPSTVEQIYVMVSSPGHPDCTPDTDSALLEDLRFKGTPVFSPLNLCIADFTDVFIETNLPGQTAQVVWAPSENIEGNLTDNPVRVKAVGSEDTIRLSYTVTAELAEGVVCVDSGTVSIPVFTDLTIDIQGDPGVCNGVGYFEGLFNANPDDIMITWSFSSDFADIIAVGKRAEVNIPEGATTIYASVAGVGDCPGAVASLSLDDVTFKAIAETEPINRCITPTGQVTLVNSFADLPMSVIWEASDNILGGLTDNPQSVTALEGEDEIVLVYMATTILEDGSECMTMDTVRIEVSDDLEVNISATELICNGIGSFVANVNAPLDSVFIEWSFSSTFDDIVGTGDSLTVEIPFGAEVIYVRTDAINPNKCNAAMNSLNLSEATYDPIEEFEPIDKCASNSTIVTLRDRMTGEIIVVAWDSSANIAGNLNANPIEIMALEGQTEVLLTYSTIFGDDCNFSGEVLVPVIGGVEIDIIGPADTTICSSPVTLNAESSVPVSAFEWSLTSTFEEIVATGRQVDIEIAAGNNTIYVRGTTVDSCGTGIDSINVNLNIPDVTPKFSPINRCISAETIVMICNNDSGQALEPIQFFFNQNITRILSDTSVMVTAMEGDTSIMIVYRAVNEAGCETTDTINIEVSDDLEVDIRPTSIVCNGMGDFVADVNAPLDSVLIEWSFDRDFTLIAGTGDSLSTEIPQNAQNIYVRTDAINPNKCTEAMDSLGLADITFDPIAQFESINLCSSAFTEVSLIDNLTGELATVQWDSSASLSGDLSANPIQVMALEGQSEVVLFYMATDSSGDCTISDSLTIPVDTVSVCDLTLVGTDNIYCAGGEENITSIAIEGTCPGVDFIYEWGPSDLIVSGGNTANPVIGTPDADNITISVRVSDGVTGCELLDTSFVLDLLKISVTISADPGTTIKCGEPLTLTANTDAVTPIFIWDGNPAINTQVYMPDPSPLETTTYSVEVIDLNGCRATASQLITVIIPECTEDVFIPSAFSPNGDGINDVLAVRGNKIDEMELQIYNRWGQEVFSAQNQRETWNGQFQNDGDKLHPDVFAYQLMVTCTDGVTIHLSGNISLMR